MVGIGYWAHRDLDSPVAKRLRELVGIPPVEVPVREVVNEPEPPREPAKEPEPEPEPELPPEPEPRALSWSELTQDSRIWPEKLQITAKQTIPIHFNRINFGYVYFVLGDALQIESLEPDGLIGLELQEDALVVKLLDPFENTPAQALFLLDGFIVKRNHMTPTTRPARWAEGRGTTPSPRSATKSADPVVSS